MFAELHSDINSPKSGFLHLMGQPYCKKSRSAKVKDGILTYFLGTISLIDTLAAFDNANIIYLLIKVANCADSSFQLVFLAKGNFKC